MRLDEITSGSIYVDANVLYMYLRADPAHMPIIKAFLALMEHLGLAAIASDDPDFDRVDGLERHWILNPPGPVSDAGSQRP